METMQITLVKALAPEPSAPEPERDDEFSSILSGKEAETKVESPPGQPPPPVQEPAVEEAEKQEPNAQSQIPDFHCNDETKSDGELPSDSAEVSEETKEAESETQAIPSTPVSTPPLAAQTALAWIGLLPEPTVAVVSQSTSCTVTAVNIDPTSTSITGDPAASQLPAANPAPMSQPAATDATMLDAPAQVAETADPAVILQAKVDTRAPAEVPINDLNALIEDKPVNVEIRVEPTPNSPATTKAQPTSTPILNVKVEQAAASNHKVETQTPSSVQPTTEPIEAMAATEVPQPARLEQAIAPDAPKAKPEDTELEYAEVQVKILTTEDVADSGKAQQSEKLIATADVSAKQSAEVAKPVTKAPVEEKPTEKQAVNAKAETIHETANVKKNDPESFGDQNQTGQGQTSDSNAEEIKSEPSQTAGVQQARTEFKLTADKPAASDRPQPIDSKKTEEVVRQIVDRVETIAATHRPGGVVIRLNPEDLGTISMAVKSIGDQVEAHIVASDDRVRTALDSSRSQLAQAIEAKGFSLKSVTVNEAAPSQSQSDLNNQDRSQSQQQTRQDQQSLRQQSNMWTYAYSSADGASQRSGFARTASSGLDLWT